MIKKLVSLFLFLFVTTTVSDGKVPAQTKKSAAQVSCERGEKLLRNENKAIVTLDHSRLKEIAVEQVSPKFPRSCRCLGVIRVSILIDTKGRVKCANSTEGNPLLRASAMQAAKKWTFNPITKEGKAMSARGELIFEFSSDGQISY